MSRVQVHGGKQGFNDVALAGDTVAVSGQTAAPDVIAAGAGFAVEFESALSSLLAALAGAGAAPTRLLHLRIFVTDMDAYVAARPDIGVCYRRLLKGHYPAATLVEVSRLMGGAQVEIEGLASLAAQATAGSGPDQDEPDAVIRLRLAPGDARYAGGIAAGSKAMEIFADLETELALREGGDEGLCVAYDMVEFIDPLRVGDFVEGRARVVRRGNTSRRVAAELYKVVGVDERGLLRSSAPVLAARASATIVVSTSSRTPER